MTLVYGASTSIMISDTFQGMKIILTEFGHVSYLALYAIGKFWFKSIMIFLYALRLVFETEPYEWDGIVDYIQHKVYTESKHTGCTKLYHFLTWYRVWKVETTEEINEAFVFFQWYTLAIWVFLYVLYFRYRFRLEDWPVRRKRDFAWIALYLLCHVVFYYFLSFLFFCMSENIIDSLSVIFEKATQPLEYHEYAMFLLKENATCWEAFFGKRALLEPENNETWSF